MLKFLIPFFAAFFPVATLIFFFKDFFARIFRVPFGGRHVNEEPVPRGGGVVIIAVFLFSVFLNPDLVVNKALLGLAFSSLIILVYGILDDIFDLKAVWQFLFQVGAVLPIIAAGVRIDFIRNPFFGILGGEAVRFDQIELFGFSLFGSFLIFGWLLFLMNAMNFLDGVDGLASGVSFSALAAVFILSLTAAVNQPAVAILAAILGGAISGFLIFNFPPSKIFLGTSGSVFLGFSAGALAIFSGAKIATAALVLTLPILDLIFVVFRRWKDGVSIFQADRRHFHHKLLAVGFSRRRIFFVYCFLSLFFGGAALFSGRPWQKLAVFSGAVAFLAILWHFKKEKFL